MRISRALRRVISGEPVTGQQVLRVETHRSQGAEVDWLCVWFSEASTAALGALVAGLGPLRSGELAVDFSGGRFLRTADGIVVKEALISETRLETVVFDAPFDFDGIVQHADGRLVIARVERDLQGSGCCNHCVTRSNMDRDASHRSNGGETGD